MLSNHVEEKKLAEVKVFLRRCSNNSPSENVFLKLTGKRPWGIVPAQRCKISIYNLQKMATATGCFR